eukprot:TRINITY_DN10064_c0_g4_i1.p1 TRINITY_DN10064_c0_g4~~TRINITY_DN10064_c0_g4_i1.p1  ORF type:complete len:469 (-),score=117.86 TRINITY_DN10064_c0_g4_i1:787-2193(-)
MLPVLPPPSNDYVGPQVFGLPAQSSKITLESVGHAYETYLRVVHGLDKLFVQDNSFVAETQENDDPDLDQKYQSHRKKSVNDLVSEDNYYDLLGLGHLKWRATQDELKKAYRQVVLVHHPDKQAQATSEADDEVFKKIQKAYETLSNPKLRKVYDSQESFDDTIPDAEDITSDSSFYQVFRPVFERNAKWSINPRVPGLGDEKTSINDVMRFYDFWYSMKTWRDYSYLDEYDPEEAESREEKRWMERKNAKERSKREREEQNRLNSLIDLSYKLDPRIRKMKEEEQRVKEEAKRKRQEAIKKKLEEEERIKREEREKEEAEALRLKEEKEAEQRERTRITRLKKKKRQNIRQTARKHDCRDDHVEYLCENLELEDLNKICDKITAMTDVDKVGLEFFFENSVKEHKNKLEENKRQLEAEAKGKIGTGVGSLPGEEHALWTPEEISLLTKVVQEKGGRRSEILLEVVRR